VAELLERVGFVFPVEVSPSLLLESRCETAELSDQVEGVLLEIR
jgi:hypothetical protein